MRCPVCGKRVKDDLAHCPNCGANLYAENGETIVKNTKKKIKVNRITIDKKNRIVLAVILVVSILVGGYKIYFNSYQDESSNISELMVENYLFKKKVAAIDDKAQKIKEAIETNLTVINVADEIEHVTNGKNNLQYSASYTLENGSYLNYSYSADSKNEKCNLSLIYVYSLNSLDEFEASAYALDTTIVQIGSTVLTTPIVLDDYDQAYLNYINKYKNGITEEEGDVFYVGSCYAFMNVEEDLDENGNKLGTYTVKMEFTFDPCEVVY